MRDNGLKCWSLSSAARLLRCDEGVLVEIIRAGLVPIIEIAPGSRKGDRDDVVGEQFDYIEGAFVPLREKA